MKSTPIVSLMMCGSRSMRSGDSRPIAPPGCPPDVLRRGREERRPGDRERLPHRDARLQRKAPHRPHRPQARPGPMPGGHPDAPRLARDLPQISTTHHASGVGAIVAQRWSPLHGASPRAGLCWVVLEAVRSEGNLGSLIGTSEAVGGAGFILVGSPDRPVRPRGRPRLDGGAVPADVHPDEPPQPPELAPPPSLSRRRRLARRVGRTPSLRLSPPDDPRPRRGAPGAHAAPAGPLLGPRPDPDGRRGRLPESRRGGEPDPVRGLSGPGRPFVAVCLDCGRNQPASRTKSTRKQKYG